MKYFLYLIFLIGFFLFGIKSAFAKTNDLSDKARLKNNIVRIGDIGVFLQESENLSYISDYDNQIKINEVLPKPSEGSENEFIELCNISPSTVNLSGWSLEDREGFTRKFTIEGISIDSSECISFFKKENTGISLNDEKDGVILRDPVGKTQDQVDYDKAIQNQSFSRFEDVWQWTDVITPKLKNVASMKKNDTNLEQEAVINGSNIEEISSIKEKNNGNMINVKGYITVRPNVLSKTYFYIQDKSSGIQIYCYEKSFPNLHEGDLVSVFGELSEINNEKRIKIKSGKDITILERYVQVAIPQELKISELDEKREGSYIKVRGRVSQTSGNQFYISDGGTNLKISINKSTGIKKPLMKKGNIVEVSGILSQYKDYYRLLPFKQEDVKIVDAKESLPITGGGLSIYFLSSFALIIIWKLFLKVKVIQLKLLESLLRKRNSEIFLRYMAI